MTPSCCKWFTEVLSSHRLANENAMKEVQTRMRDVQRQNDQLTSELKKKEREIEVKMEETVARSTLFGHSL